MGHPVADHQKDFSSVYKPFWFNYINSEGIAFPFFCIYLHTLYYKACKWLKYNGFGLKVKFRVVAQILKQSEFSMLFCTGRSSLILLFHCTNGADRTGPINTREPQGCDANPWSGHAHTSNTKYVREVRTGRSIDRGSHPHLVYVLGGKYVLIEVRAATPV
jgi:hypothetical protein